MKILIPAALIGLAVYWGTLLSPRIKSLVIKLKNKLTKTKNNNNQEKEKENESKSN